MTEQTIDEGIKERVRQRLGRPAQVAIIKEFDGPGAYGVLLNINHECKLAREVEERDFLRREYESGTGRFVFKVNRIKPHFFATSPVIFDYDLLVDIKRNNPNGSTDAGRNISFGSHFGDYTTRRFIEFGERYFNDTYSDICEVIMLACDTPGDNITEADAVDAVRSLSRWSR